MSNTSQVISIKKWSFTLIELLIVVSIIGILAEIAIPNCMNAVLKAKIASTYVRMKNTHSAIHGYMIDHQMSPPPIAGTVGSKVAFSALTTPVNYLGSLDVCEDVLRQYDYYIRPDNSAEKVTKKTYFIYEPMTAHPLSRSQSAIVKTHDIGISYLLISTGPDGYNQNIFPLLFLTFKSPKILNYLYSSTNGLRSYGDIVSTNVKTYQ
jgi:prepilin-type N-terminal cleavage/methylation domain-containing protein